MTDLRTAITRKWHDAIEADILEECGADSEVGRDIVAVCAAADLLLERMHESTERARVVRAVAEEIAVWWFG